MNNNVFKVLSITEEERKRANKYKDSKDVIECANHIKDSAIKFEKLDSKDKKIAAIIVSGIAFEERKK